MAVRWHELVGTQERGLESLESAECLRGGEDAGSIGRSGLVRLECFSWEKAEEGSRGQWR